MTYLDYMRRDKSWHYITTTMAIANLLVPYLQSHDIYFKPSEAGNLVHFELYMNDIEARLVTDFLERNDNERERS